MVFNPALHGLRGLAALLVLLYHWRTNFPAAGNVVSKLPFAGERWNLMFLIDYGWVGVHWFFVLSGYLLAGVLWREPLRPQTVVHFWQRRFARIYPAHWFQIAVMALFTGYTLLLSNLQPTRFINNLLLWLDPLPGGSIPYNGVWWSLPIELSFYLVLPFVVLFYRKTSALALFLGALAISIGWRWLVVEWRDSPDDPIYRNVMRLLPGSLSLFVAGSVLNHWRDDVRIPHWKPLLVATLAFYVFWLDTLGLSKRPPRADDWTLYLWEPVLGVAIAALVWLLTRPAHAPAWLSSKPLLWLGTWSYGIYLWHFPVMRLLPKLVPGPWKTVEGSLLALPVCLAITLPLAALSYHAVEKPVLSGLARWQSRRKTRPSS